MGGMRQRLRRLEVVETRTAGDVAATRCSWARR